MTQWSRACHPAARFVKQTRKGNAMKLIFLGPPGAGKGTVANAVTSGLGIVQISTGDLLREAVKKGTDLGRKAKAFMDAGELVPDALVINLLRERISASDCRKGFILDGFPRTIPQAEALEKAGVSVDKVVNFVLADSIIITRLSGRRVHKQTGKVYNVNPGGYPPPPAGMPASELIQRDDDKPEAIRNRLVVYAKQTQPLTAFYTSRGLLADIDAGRDVDGIVKELKPILGF